MAEKYFPAVRGIERETYNVLSKEFIGETEDFELRYLAEDVEETYTRTGDIDEQIRKALGKLQDELQGKADVKKGDVKWVNPQSMHLTLKFLGEIKDQQVVEVCNITKEVANRHAGFELDVGTVGFFGGKSARVLWVGT